MLTAQKDQYTHHAALSPEWMQGLVLEVGLLWVIVDESWKLALDLACWG